MIRHIDFDANETTNTYKLLPDIVDRIGIDYDGGRLEIYVNGSLFHKVSVGTRDCSISIDNEHH